MQSVQELMKAFEVALCVSHRNFCASSGSLEGRGRGNEIWILKNYFVLDWQQQEESLLLFCFQGNQMEHCTI